MDMFINCRPIYYLKCPVVDQSSEFVHSRFSKMVSRPIHSLPRTISWQLCLSNTLVDDRGLLGKILLVELMLSTLVILPSSTYKGFITGFTYVEQNIPYPLVYLDNIRLIVNMNDSERVHLLLTTCMVDQHEATGW